MRLGRLICGDIHFQWKYGFYFIYFILTVLYVCGIAALPEHWKTDIASIMIYSDPAAMGLFFMGAIVLLEKSQKVLNAMVVSPVKISEYILSKTVALIAISTVIALILGLVSGSNHLLGIAVGTALTSAIFTMLGIIAATKISNYCWSVCDFTRCVLLFSVHGLYEPYNWKKYVTIVRYGNCNCYVEYPLHNCKGYS